MSAEPAVLDLHPPRRGWFRRRCNRRATVQRRSLLLLVAAGLTGFGRGALVVVKVLGKLLAVAAAIAGACWGGQWAVEHVVNSPRFRVRHIDITPGARVARAEVLELAAVREDDRLLLIDTDAVAARVAEHPWVAGVRVGRQLPAGLRIEIIERRAAALAALGGLYLVDESGRPFKRATMDEAENLVVLTGVSREQYTSRRPVAEAVLREGLRVLEAYRARPGRPELSEIAIDARLGFTLFLLENGAEIRLGRAEPGEKLAQLDQILEAVSAGNMGGIAAIRIVHLDAPGAGRVPVLLRARPAETAPPDEPRARPRARSGSAPTLARN